MSYMCTKDGPSQNASATERVESVQGDSRELHPESHENELESEGIHDSPWIVVHDI